MEKRFLIGGLALGLLAVLIGAFGAHALKPLLNVEQQQSFETGVRYQMYHALLMIFIARQASLASSKIFYCLLFGIILFSFSIYLLNLKHLIGIETLGYLGPVTPLGGILLIFSWVLLLIKSLGANNITTPN